MNAKCWRVNAKHQYFQFHEIVLAFKMQQITKKETYSKTQQWEVVLYVKTSNHSTEAEQIAEYLYISIQTKFLPPPPPTPTPQWKK